MTIQEMREKRAGLVAQARALNDKVGAEEREFSAEETSNYDAMMDEVAKIGDQVKREERLAQVEADLNASAGVHSRENGNAGDDQGQALPNFVSRALRGVGADLLEMREWAPLMATTTPEYRGAVNAWLRTGVEQRALQVDVNTAGGYLVSPLQMVDRIIQALDNAVYIRQWATTFGVPNADALGAVSLDNDPADPTWTNELAIGDEDSTMSFGRRELRPHPLAKYIKISNTLLRKVPSVDGLVIDRLAYKFGVTQENSFLNGSGAQQPLGVFTASNDGIPAGRDVSSENTTTAMTFNGLINAKYALKQGYWGRSRWLFHADGMKQLAKIKDGNSQYIWRESVSAGEPDRLLNIPVFTSEYAPNTFTASQYVGILGDFANYWIADALDMTFQRLVELFAATNQVAIVGRMESDGQPVLAEAFVRVKLAAS